MKKWMTKKNVLGGAFIGSILFFLFIYSQDNGLCGQYAWDCGHSFDLVGLMFLVFLPLFLISLLTYKLCDEIFNAWIMFAKWWIPLTIVFVLLAPASDGSLLPIDKGRVSLFMNALFITISLILTTYKFFQLKKSGAGE